MVLSGNSTEIEGFGSLLGRLFSMVEFRVRVGSGRSCGVKAMQKCALKPTLTK